MAVNNSTSSGISNAGKRNRRPGSMERHADYGLGFLSLIASIGLSGWLRSKKNGLITTGIASIAVVFFVIATPYGF